MQTLVQDSLPVYSWEDLHFLLWLKTFFFFLVILKQRQVMLWAEGEAG